MQDLRYAVRLLVRSPSFTAVAVATLALGVAATTAVFSITHALLLRPLPYAAPERLVMLWQDQRARGGPEDEWLGPAHFFDWRSRSRLLESSAVFRTARPSLAGTGEPEQLDGWAVSGEFFDMLAVRPAVGRGFRPEDDRPGAPITAIITHELWTRRFGGDPAIVGRTISLDREPVAIIGVLPAGYRNPFAAPDVFRPLQLDPASAARGNITLQMIARVRPGVALAQVQAEMATIGAALAAEHPDTDAGSTIRVTRLHEEVVGDLRAPVLALLGAVVLVLLIACANIANLQLARASSRAREFALRAALGAGRGRIVRQLLAETAVLGVVGSAAGLMLSFWALEALLALAPEGTPRVTDIRIDVPVVAFGLLVALMTLIVFGLVPAFHGVRGGRGSALKETRGSVGHGSVTARSAFVVLELALALMLLVGAGLLMRTLVNMRGVDPGFAPERVVSAVIALPLSGYEDAGRVRVFYGALLERLHTIPGAAGAGLVSVMPFSGADTDTAFFIEGRPRPATPGDVPRAWYRIVSAGYRSAIGLRLEAGRFVEERDRDGAERVAVINRTLASRYWPNEDPIGRRILTRREADGPITIVGVVADVHHRSVRERPDGEMYLSYQQFTSRRQTLVVKAHGDAAALVPAVRHHVAALDPNLPLAAVATLDELMAESLALPRMLTTLMGAFAAGSLLLAAIGIYGVIAYVVTLRTPEFGIRMALGARPGDVLRLVIGQSVRLAALGIAAGGLAAFSVARLMAALLFGVTPTDIATFAGTAGLLAAVALLAAYLPARRAMHVDPAIALRGE
jgi:putative ABC transport system permease protein